MRPPTARVSARRRRQTPPRLGSSETFALLPIGVLTTGRRSLGLTSEASERERAVRVRPALCPWCSSTRSPGDENGSPVWFRHGAVVERLVEDVLGDAAVPRHLSQRAT